MKTSIYGFLLLLSNLANLEAYMVHERAPLMQTLKHENLKAFDELIMSWNANRPTTGKFLFYISVKAEEWSPWLLYAVWGSDGQSTFLSTTEEAPVRIYQNALTMLEGKKATGFQIKIIVEGDAHLDNIQGLHIYINNDKPREWQKPNPYLSSVHLNVPGLSQMTLNHSRHAVLCSPTSATAVVRYLSGDYTLDPLSFAQNAWDSGFDIFGSWIFNVAQASTLLGNRWDCWVERLHGFSEIHRYLNQGTPVIVSLRSPLPGSAHYYAKGHLLAVIGYNSTNQKVMCMDPAFSTDHETLTFYDLEDFVQAWNRRGNIAYVFTKACH